MSRLGEAAERGDIGAIRAALADGEPIDGPSGEGGATPLMIAAGEGRALAVRYLLDRGADPNFQETTRLDDGTFHSAVKDNETALMRAAMIGSVEIAEALLDAGAEIKHQSGGRRMISLEGEETEMGWGSPVGWAIAYGHGHMLDLLFERGAPAHDWVCVGHAEIGIAGFAVIMNDLPSLKKLVLEAEKQNENILGWGSSLPMNTTAGLAALYGRREILKFLIEKDSELLYSEGMSGENAVALALTPCLRFGSMLPFQNLIASVDRESLFQWLMKEDIPARRSSEEYASPLVWYAANNGNADSVRLALAQGKSIDGALFVARTQEVVDVLLEAGADLHERGEKGFGALHCAAQSGYQEVLERLLELGLSPNLADDDGRTPFMAAVHRNNAEALETLLKAGADPFLRDNEGRSALHLAAANADVEIIQRLVELGLSVHDRDAEGRTPFMLAARSDREEGLEALLEAGADPFVRDNADQTALHLAAEHDARGIIKSLVELGLPVDDRDAKGQTPLHRMSDRKYGYISVEALLDLGADIEARDNLGRTPLFLAASHPNLHGVGALIEAGADRHAANNEGVTPEGAVPADDNCRGFDHLLEAFEEFQRGG